MLAAEAPSLCVVMAVSAQDGQVWDSPKSNTPDFLTLRFISFWFQDFDFLFFVGFLIPAFSRPREILIPDWFFWLFFDSKMCPKRRHALFLPTVCFNAHVLIAVWACWPPTPSPLKNTQLFLHWVASETWICTLKFWPGWFLGGNLYVEKFCRRPPTPICI